MITRIDGGECYTRVMLRAAILLYDALLGFALLFGPWTRLWQENWLVWQSGSLQSFLMSGPVRGAVSGFGAAFLIHTAGRLAGIAMVEGDEVVAAPRPPHPGPGEDEAPTAGRSEEPPRAPEARAGSAPLTDAGTNEAAPAGIREP